jgi:hypothetical protein
MTIADDLRRFADECHKMALATNKSEWDDLAERWLHCIPSLERAAKEITLGEIRMSTQPEWGIPAGIPSSFEKWGHGMRLCSFCKPTTAYPRLAPHSSLDGSTPDQAYFNQLPLRLAA